MEQGSKTMANDGKLTSGLRRFAISQTGTTAITFALSIVPILLAGGAAIDYVRYTQAETRMQAALDSGALAVAAAASLSNADRIAAGEESFDANLASSGIDSEGVESSFKLTGNTVKASARFDLPSGLMQVAGLTRMTIDVSTEINVPDSKSAEIALVLDYSGSMGEVSGGQVKYVAMKNAASKLISDLETSNPDKVKVGLVPFSHHVYVTLPNKFIVGGTGTGNWTGCTQDRRYPFNLSDETPGATNPSKWGHPFSKAHLGDGCDHYAPNHMEVVPLTNDFGGLRDQLADMRPYAWTHIALGAEFGYHLLSPNEPFGEGAAYGNKGVSKVMVILTDGRQTEPSFGDGTRSVAQGESNLEAICQNAKDSGITVMTVAFDLRDIDTRDRLSDCSSDPAKHFFVAEDSAELAGAFEDIKKQITAQVYISR
jgi:Flp pilus assembly protein TadG